MSSFIISILGILLTLILVIGIHEFGHFITARLCGIKVLRFSIGFGKALYKWNDNSGTEYVIAAIPLGGYVKMLDEHEDTVPEDQLHFTFSRQPLYKRMAVIVAGPLTNLILAGFLYWLLFVIGFTSVKPITGHISPDSIAAKAGMQSQQQILSIDNQPVTTWYSIAIKILERSGDKNTLQIETESLITHKQASHALDLTNWHMDELKPDPLASLGIEPYEPEILAVIHTIQKDSPAEKAGLKVDDKILAINSEPVKDWYTLINKITLSADKTLQFKIERHGKNLILPVTVGYQRDLFFKKHGYLGIMPDAVIPNELLRHNQFGLISAIVPAFQEVKDFSYMNFIVLGKMFSGKISLQSLGGPITIFESAGSALNHGIIPFLSFLAFLSISIGIINVLPVPGLDGGHLLFQIIEFIIRRPIPERVLVLFYRLGLIFLVLLILQSLTNDLMRL